MKTVNLTLSALLIAIGTISSHLIYIPIGVANCYPVQHTINVISAVLMGPYYAVLNAFAISLLRNMLGTGSLLAFPGSMLGALVAGLIYKRINKLWPAVVGEIFGTGILGGIIAYPVAKFIIGKDVAMFFFVVPFLISTLGGSLVAFVLLKHFAKQPIFQRFMSKRKQS